MVSVVDNVVLQFSSQKPKQRRHRTSTQPRPTGKKAPVHQLATTKQSSVNLNSQHRHSPVASSQHREWCVQIDGAAARVLFPVRGRTGGTLTAPHPGKRRVIVRVRMPGRASFYCAYWASRRPVRRSPPLISYAFLICRHFARRVRRVLRGSAVIYIYVYIVFSPLPVRRYSAVRIAALLSAVRTRSEQSFRQAESSQVSILFLFLFPS